METSDHIHCCVVVCSCSGLRADMGPQKQSKATLGLQKIKTDGLWTWVEIEKDDGLIKTGNLSGGRASGSPPSFFIWLVKPMDFKLNINKEQAISEKIKAVGLKKDVKTGIQSFDEKYDIEGKPEDAALKFLTEKDRALLLDEFLEKGFTAFKADKKGLGVFLTDWEIEFPEPAFIEETATKVLVLVK